MTSSVQIEVKDGRGEVVDTIEVSDAVFGLSLNRALVHQALVAQRANARQGTVGTKSRGQVSGGGRKPRPQKHTGRSRQGSIRAPQWRGGGVVFGPQARSYRQRLPKKMRRLALCSLLSEKIRRHALLVVDKFDMETPRTKEMANLLTNLGVDRSALVVTEGADRQVALSIRNLPRTKWIQAYQLNVGDLARYRYAVITRSGIRRAESIWTSSVTRGRRPAVQAEPREEEA